MRLICCAVCLMPLAGLATGEGTVVAGWTGRFEPALSAYGLFADAARQMPEQGLAPYEVITPLFTDYADKHRFVYVPPGQRARYEESGAFGLPVGAVLVKTFSYPHDFRAPEKGRRLIETRLMFHTEQGWRGAAYLWNDAQTDAALKVAGAEVPVSWIDSAGDRRETKYLVPNMNECKACHSGEGEMQPLGVTARQLNRDHAYAGGSENQLAHWSRTGILEGAPAPEKAPRLPAWDDAAAGSLDERARAYLDANCAHCHNPRGYASHTRLDFRYEGDEQERRGVFHRPTAAGNASRGHLFAVTPGEPEASFLLHRLRSTEADVRMPEMGRTVAHDEAVALIAEWIASLAP